MPAHLVTPSPEYRLILNSVSGGKTVAHPVMQRLTLSFVYWGVSVVYAYLPVALVRSISCADKK